MTAAYHGDPHGPLEDGLKVETWYFPCKYRYDEENGTLHGRADANDNIARRARSEPAEKALIPRPPLIVDGQSRASAELDVFPDTDVGGADHPEGPDGAPDTGGRKLLR